MFLGTSRRNSRDWNKALEHVALHFRPISIELKKKHGVFEPKFRTREAVEALISKALTKLGRKPVVTRLTIDNVPAGKPAVILEKEFTEIIGHEGDHECKILRIIVDFTGRPITACPVGKFYAGAAVAVPYYAASSSDEASELPDPVKKIYAEEADAAQKRFHHECGNSLFDYVLDFLTGPTCIGLDPQEMITDKDLAKRIGAAIAKVESQVGFKLDCETQQNIRDDICKLWCCADLVLH